MVCCRLRWLGQLFQNKEKVTHLICAAIFLYLIQDLNTLRQCHLSEHHTQDINPVKVTSELEKSKENMTQVQQIETIKFENLQQGESKYQHDPSLKYILEVLGPKSSVVSIIGTTKFRGKIHLKN